MIIKSNAVQKEYISFSQVCIGRRVNLKNIVITIFTALVFFCVLLFVSKGFGSNDHSKNMIVADFRTDVNKLWESSRTIESMRNNKKNSDLHAFGATGKVLNRVEINKNLQRVLIKVADIDGDNKLSEDEIMELGIMSLNEDIYAKELKNLQLGLTIDNNLNNYVIISKGKFAGTVLYNGILKFIDSNKKCYFGVELFEQL